MINIDWLKTNLGENLIIFDIGCSGIRSTPLIFRDNLPNAVIYAFECNDFWKQENIEESQLRNINYFHMAVSNVNAKKMFRPSLTQNGEIHPYSGSFYLDLHTSSGKVYGEPYEVDTIRYDTFCEQNNVVPDFIHIDVEGEEYNVLSCLGPYKPKVIWTEIVGFNTYNVDCSEVKFNIMLSQYGYRLMGKTNNGNDGLYCLIDQSYTPYEFTQEHKWAAL